MNLELENCEPSTTEFIQYYHNASNYETETTKKKLYHM